MRIDVRIALAAKRGADLVDGLTIGGELERPLDDPFFHDRGLAGFVGCVKQLGSMTGRQNAMSERHKVQSLLAAARQTADRRDARAAWARETAAAWRQA